MKLTKSKLKQLIKEELANVYNENDVARIDEWPWSKKPEYQQSVDDKEAAAERGFHTAAGMHRDDAFWKKALKCPMFMDGLEYWAKKTLLPSAEGGQTQNAHKALKAAGLVSKWPWGGLKQPKTREQRDLISSILDVLETGKHKTEVDQWITAVKTECAHLGFDK